MKFLATILFTGVFFVVIGQNINFVKSYGNSGYDVAKDIKQDVDTGYICVGSSSSFYPDNNEAFLMKVDSLGNFQWSYNYGGSGSEWGESLVVTNDSAYAFCGYTNSMGAGGFDFYLVKTTNLGVPEFETTYGGPDWDRSFGLAQFPDSGFVLVGETYSFGAGNADLYVVRTDKNGDTLWTRTWGGTEDDYASDVIVDGDSIVVVGGTESFGAGMSDGVILKYHKDGTLGWSKVVGMERNDYFTSIVENVAGTEYFLGGSRMYYYDQTGELDDFWIYNISEDGNTLFADTSMTGGSHEVEIAHDITVDFVDNVFWAGQTKSFGHAITDGENDAWLGKLLNTYYQANYVQNFGQLGEDIAYAIDFCYDLGIVACGTHQWQSSGGVNMFIVRVDKDNLGGQITVTTEMTFDSLTLSYEEMTHPEELLVYPTIVENYVNFQGFPENSEYAILSVNGQIVKSRAKLEDSVIIDDIEPGLYLLVVYSGGSRYTQKIIKN